MAKDFRQIALTAPQVIAILLLIATLILGCAAIARIDDEPADWVASYRLYMGLATACCALASISLFVWHTVRARRPDVYPDVLAQIVNAGTIAEMDTLHFWAAARQSGDQVRVIILLQNVYAAPCSGRLTLAPVGTTRQIKDAAQAWEFELGEGEVIAAWRDMPVPSARELSFGINGFIRKVRAPRVRFKRHTVIQSQTGSGMLVAGLMVGHLHYNSGSRIEVKITSPPPDSAALPPSGPWQMLSLWSPQEPRNPSDVGKLLAHVFAE